MIDLIVELSRYAFIILIAMYTFLSFSVLRKKNQEEINHGWKVQNLITFLIHLLAFGVIFIQTWQIRILIFYLLQVFLLQAVLVRAEAYARSALQWLMDEGLASAVNVTAENPVQGVLSLKVSITRTSPSVVQRVTEDWQINITENNITMGAA